MRLWCEALGLRISTQRESQSRGFFRTSQPQRGCLAADITPSNHCGYSHWMSVDGCWGLVSATTVGCTGRGGEGCEHCYLSATITCGWSWKLMAAVLDTDEAEGRGTGEISEILTPPHLGSPHITLSLLSLWKITGSPGGHFAHHISNNMNGAPGAVHCCGPGRLGCNSYEWNASSQPDTLHQPRPHSHPRGAISHKRELRCREGK